MADSTTVINHCNIKISLDKADGTLTDISGSSNELEITSDIKIEEYRVFGSTGMKRIVGCAKDAKFKLTVLYSTAADEASDIIKKWRHSGDPGLARSLRYEVPNGSSGSDRYDQEVILGPISVTFSSESAGPVKVVAELMLNGAAPVLSTVP